MDEIKEGEGNIPAAGKSSKSEDESKLKDSPKTYNKKEFDDAVSKVGIEWGVEVQNLKSTIANLNTQIADTKATLEELTSTDPEKADVAKLHSELKEQKRQLTAKELTFAEREKVVMEAERLNHIKKIAVEFEQNDPEKLTNFCNKFKVANDEASIRDAAEALGWTKPAEPVKKPVIVPKADSGQSSGGGESLNSLTIPELKKTIDKK